MHEMRFPQASLAILIISLISLFVFGACSSRQVGPRAQAQEVDIASTPTPQSLPATGASTIIATRAAMVTPTWVGPLPTLDPRTPVVPTIYVTPPPTATPRPSPAPSHTPGLTPTNPPGEEVLVRQAFAAAVRDRLARGLLPQDTQSRLAINSVRIEGPWALLGIHRELLSGTPAAAGGGIALARKIDGQWRVAFGTDPEFRPWLDALPNSLLTPQDRFWYA